MKDFYSAENAEFSLIKGGKVVLKSNDIAGIIAQMSTGDSIKVSIPGGIIGEYLDFILDVKSEKAHH